MNDLRELIGEPFIAPHPLLPHRPFGPPPR